MGGWVGGFLPIDPVSTHFYLIGLNGEPKSEEGGEDLFFGEVGGEVGGWVIGWFESFILHTIPSTQSIQQLIRTAFFSST